MQSKLKITDRRCIYDGWNTFDVLTVETLGDDGNSRRHEREVLGHGPAVALLAYDPDRRQALLARQWRVPLLAMGDDPFLLEACAGLIDAGETPPDAAIREAVEELGLHLEAVRKVVEIYTSPGSMTEKIHLFLATYGLQDRRSDGGGLDHEGEDIEIIEMPLDALFEMAKTAHVADVPRAAIQGIVLSIDTDDRVGDLWIGKVRASKNYLIWSNRLTNSDAH